MILFCKIFFAIQLGFCKTIEVSTLHLGFSARQLLLLQTVGAHARQLGVSTRQQGFIQESRGFCNKNVQDSLGSQYAEVSASRKGFQYVGVSARQQGVSVCRSFCKPADFLPNSL